MSHAKTQCPIPGCSVERNTYIETHIRAAHTPEELGLGPFPQEN
jgi:hypothetical protein